MPAETWRTKLSDTFMVLQEIQPGMRIFIGTGVAEPRALIRQLLARNTPNLQDLSLTQLISLGGLLTLAEIDAQKFRLKTCFTGWVAHAAAAAGRIDLIPSRFSRIPELIESGWIRFDAAFVQISPPDEQGFCSLGLAVDVASRAMRHARIVVGEINRQMPRTSGDTLVHVDDFDLFVENDEEIMTLPPQTPEPVYNQIAENLTIVIENGDCLAFSVGPLYDAASRALATKRDLGIHSPFFTDALMNLVQAGAVTNQRKAVCPGRSLTSYALGSAELYRWLDGNPAVEFGPLDKVFNPLEIGRNPNFVALLPARKVDVAGNIALHSGRGNVTAAPGEAMDFINGAELSPGGRTIFALPSRNLKGEANICLSIKNFDNQLSLPEAVDLIVTEYGIASLKGRSVRERAQAIIDIAHPDDRELLLEQARAAKLVYADQIYIHNTAYHGSNRVNERHSFKDVDVLFRHIRPSDEEGMRRLFYTLSDQTVYYRYFCPIKVMPHTQMQRYASVDSNRTVSVVGLAGKPGQRHIIAEARYLSRLEENLADVAFIVDERYRGLGIAGYLHELLGRMAIRNGLEGFRAEVFATNKPMLRVFERGPWKPTICQGGSILELRMPFGAASASQDLSELAAKP